MAAPAAGSRVVRRPVVVFVCGEPQRGDDSAAYRAADALPGDVLAIARVQRVGMLSPEAVSGIAPGSAVVVADAVVGVRPGAIVTLPLRTAATGGGPTPRSSHSLPLHQVLGLASILGDGLPDGTFVGLGAATFEIGEPPSRPVLDAIPGFAEAIAAEVRRLASGDAEALGP